MMPRKNILYLTFSTDRICAALSKSGSDKSATVLEKKRDSGIDIQHQTALLLKEIEQKITVKKMAAHIVIDNKWIIRKSIYLDNTITDTEIYDYLKQTLKVHLNSNKKTHWLFDFIKLHSDQPSNKQTIEILAIEQEKIKPLITTCQSYGLIVRSISPKNDGNTLDTNLLPWRENSQKKKLRQFLFSSITFFAIGIALIIIFRIFLNENIQHNMTLERKLSEKIALLRLSHQQKIEYTHNKKLIAQWRSIKLAQKNNARWQALIKFLAASTPIDATLKQLTIDAHGVKLSGIIASINQLDLWQTQFKNSGLFQDPILKNVQQNKEKMLSFTLALPFSAQQKNTNTRENQSKTNA